MAAPVQTITPAFDRAQAFDVDPIIVQRTEWGNVYEVLPPGSLSTVQIDLPNDPAFAAIAISPDSLVGSVTVIGFNVAADYFVQQIVTPKAPLLFPPQLQAAAMPALSNQAPPAPPVIQVQAVANTTGTQQTGPLLTTQQRSPAGVISTIDYGRFRLPTLELYLYRRLPTFLPRDRGPLIDRAGNALAGLTIPASGVVRGWPIGQRRRMRLEVFEVGGGGGGQASLEVTATGGQYLTALPAPPITNAMLETAVATGVLLAGQSTVFEIQIEAEFLFLRAAVTAGAPRLVLHLKAED